MRLAGPIAAAVTAATLLTGCATYRPTGAYGLEFENSFLYSCELRSPVARCTCLLGYLEQNYSLQQVVADYQAGVIATDMQPGVNACQFAVL